MSISNLKLKDGQHARRKQINNLRGQLMLLQTQNVDIFGNKIKEDAEIETIRLEKLITQREAELENAINSPIYRNAFEWRFEFPEVLDEEGKFVGFDAVVGNPPYGVKFDEREKVFYKQEYSIVHTRTPESFNYFISKILTIANSNGHFGVIIPSTFLNQIEFEKARKLMLENYSIDSVLNLGDGVFYEVTTPTCIVLWNKQKDNKHFQYADHTALDRNLLPLEINQHRQTIELTAIYTNGGFSFLPKSNKSIIEKCNQFDKLKDIAEDVATGVSPGLGDAFVISNELSLKLNLEEEILENLITGGGINKFVLDPKDSKKLIYCTSQTKIEKYDNCFKHLSSFRERLDGRTETKTGVIPWYIMLRPRRKKLFEEPKILLRQTANRIIACYDEDKWYCLKSGLIIQLPKQSKIHYYYLLGVLNSSTMNFLYQDLVHCLISFLVFNIVIIYFHIMAIEFFSCHLTTKLPVDFNSQI